MAKINPYWLSTIAAGLLIVGCGAFDSRVSAPLRDDSTGRLRWSDFKEGSAALLSLRPLNDLDIFLRCYSQLTGTDLDPGDVRIQAIKTQKLSGRYACRELFKSVTLTEGGDVSSPSPEKRAVLNRMHRIHSSFFLNQSLYIETNSDFTKVKENLLDPSAPALFFTKALFRKDEKFDDIFRGNKNLTSVRAQPLAPTSPNLLLRPTFNLAQSIFGAGFDAMKYQKVGELLGIGETPSFEIIYTAGSNFYPGSDGRIEFGQAFGGGILGSPVYLQNNVHLPTHGEGPAARATVHQWDGGVHIGRKWSVSIFKDFLCQDLPSLEPDDVSGPDFVSSDSNAPPFRNSAACASCHASMDPMAGAIRNIAYQPHGPKNAVAGSTSAVGTTELFKVLTSSISQAEEWPFLPDQDYAQRPPTGKLMYRTSDGKLVDEKFDNLDQLGELLAQQNDVYRCVTKRYMEYFMGIKIPIRSTVRDARKDIYLSELNRLTSEFKQHKNLNRLVDQVLMSNLYGAK